MVIDDFVATAAASDDSGVEFWPNPTFEDGAQLIIRYGAPTGWNRGGSDSRGDVVLHDKATS